MIETGVLFDNIHSYHNFGLILASVEVPPAVPKVTYIDIPGCDGSIDLTEAFGEIFFSNRLLKFVFFKNPESDLSESAWEAKKTEVSNYLNGRICKITLDKDPEYYWVGRCAVDSYASQKRLRQFTVSALVRPYKLKQAETAATFTLNTSGETVILNNGRKSVCPRITCTADNTKVTFGGNTYTLNAGTHRQVDIRLKEGKNYVTISGSGQITFTYQEGDL